MTRLLTRSDVERLLDLRACIDAVERAFRMAGEGRPLPSAILGLAAPGGGMHVKAALATEQDGHGWFAAKVNLNFPGNPDERGLPTIQGVVVLADAQSGSPLAVMDSIALTVLRTAAASAVAARHLARRDARTVAIVGCGAQARAQLAAMRIVRPVERASAFDANAGKADAFARAASAELGFPVRASATLGDATRDADIVVTCTTARRAFLGGGDLSRGTFVAAVGADSESKQEIEPALMATSAVVTDSTAQCAAIGDLHHAIDARVMTAADVRAELGDVVADPSRGRRTADEIVVFDSTGVAFQDVVAAALVHERAERENVGRMISFGE